MTKMYRVLQPNVFWERLAENIGKNPKYSRQNYVEVVQIMYDVIAELEEKGFVSENGWDEHVLIKQPFADGHHFEFHTFDDDVLVVYFKRESHNRIRMVGVYTHESLPNTK